MNTSHKWDLIIESRKSNFRLGIRELLKYRDLIFLFVKRDLISVYKQTILGPLWYFIQPILTTLTFTFIFGKIAGLSSNGAPYILFYMSGIVLWSYFSDCFRKTSITFVSNAQIFSKVYFPRLVIPISIVISSLISLSIQLLLFSIFWIYFYFNSNSEIFINWQIFLLPFLIIIMAFMGLGFGILVSSITTKYRDFSFLVGFGIQLMMYISPVIFPLTSVPDNLKLLVLANPMSSIIETFRMAVLGAGTFSWWHLLYSLIFTMILFLLSVYMFNRVERSFTDTL